VLLTLIYLGLIISLQFLLGGLINQDSPIAIVASTLLIAALFQPLRKRIQAVIDRRFFRHKYDAASTSILVVTSIGTSGKPSASLESQSACSLRGGMKR
jgi:hypothetical protein